MRVLFIISTMGHGRGGHFSSLKTTAEKLSERLDCSILNVGVAPSEILKSSFVDYHFVSCNGTNLLDCSKKLSDVVERKQPDVVHSFDLPAHFWARSLAQKHKLVLFHTKCGGPNPKKYYPYAENLILYSKENLEYFQRTKKYSTSKIFLLPNRSVKVGIDRQRIGELRQKYDCDRNVFLRIARFSAAYEKSLLQTINLVRELNKLSGNNYRLLLIGAIQDQGVFDRIRSCAGSNTSVISDSRYTHNANELLHIADYVVGTGRGFMEAASLGKVLLAPVANSDYPVLIGSENFEHFFERNFSPRAAPARIDTPEQIYETIANAESRRQLQEFSQQAFEEFFSIDAVVKVYVQIYSRALPYAERHLLDLSINFLVAGRNYFSAARARAR